MIVATIGRFLLGSCAGRMLLLVSLMFVGAQVTKGMAVRKAVMKKVAFYEISVLEAELAESERLKAVAEQALLSLQIQSVSDDLELEQSRAEILKAESEDADPACIVSDGFIGGLRAN